MTKDPEMEGIETKVTSPMLCWFLLTKDPEMEGIETIFLKVEVPS
ncbi:Uncharacterized protein dnm_053060 [Desulfonema magnum]|uniref:Uncharacterized protein n=1 Tax=Desulfonema magnum TaxID=45655 RepID=A0A975BPI0_9BACT|nr:Uncharacterized protein dnm_053060 [Desulfonema magnum]